MLVIIFYSALFTSLFPSVLYQHRVHVAGTFATAMEFSSIAFTTILASSLSASISITNGLSMAISDSPTT